MPTFRQLQQQALDAGVPERDANMAMDKQELVNLMNSTEAPPLQLVDTLEAELSLDIARVKDEAVQSQQNKTKEDKLQVPWHAALQMPVLIDSVFARVLRACSVLASIARRLRSWLGT